MKTSIIVPIFNGSRYLTAFFDSLLKAAPDGAEIILVDDASTEPVFDLIPDHSLFQNAIRLHNDVNRGYSGTVNRGFEVATGDIIIQLNTDLILHKHCITEMVKWIESNNNVGIVGSKLSFPTTGRVQHVGMAFGLFSKPHIYFEMPADHPLCNRTRKLQIITGATVGMTKSVLDKIGPLDERYYNCNEDIDHCLKARRAGFDNYFVASSEAYHWVSQSGPARFSLEEEAEALFWSSWASDYDVDLGVFVRESLDYLANITPGLIDRKFQILNLCKSLDESILINEIAGFWPGTDQTVLHHRPHNLPQTTLWLAMILPHWLVDCPFPYIYVVDNAKHLSENWHWFKNRQARVPDEIIVDLTGAAYLTSEFVRLEWPAQ